MLGFPILHLKGTRIVMFQLSGFYCKFLCLGWDLGIRVSLGRFLGGLKSQRAVACLCARQLHSQILGPLYLEALST